MWKQQQLDWPGKQKIIMSSKKKREKEEENNGLNKEKSSTIDESEHSKKCESHSFISENRDPDGWQHYYKIDSCSS